MAKSKWLIGGDKKRNAIIIGGFFSLIIIFIIGLWVFSIFRHTAKPPAQSIIAKAKNTDRVKTSQNQEYVKQLEGYNARKGNVAIEQGNSWISIPTYYSEQIKSSNNEQLTKTDYRISDDPVPVRTVKAGMKPASVARKEAEDILNKIQSTWSYSTPVDSVSSDVGSYAQVFMPAVATHQALNAAASSTTPAVVPFQIYEAFKICPAHLLTQLDTDTNSIVRAKLLCQELPNATLYAPGYKLVGENIDMTFTMMTFKRNSDDKARTYKIQAKPIDLETGRSMLTGEVDHHYVRRIVVPALSLGVQKVGTLYEKSTSDTTVVSNGTVISSSDGKVSAEQVKGTFLGGLAQQTAEVIKADNARVPPIQVTRKDQPTFGVVFIEPVMSTDAATPSGQTTTSASNNQDSFSQPAGEQQRSPQFRGTAPTIDAANPGPIFSNTNVN